MTTTAANPAAPRPPWPPAAATVIAGFATAPLDPPGQLSLLPTRPGPRRASYRIVWIHADAGSTANPTGTPRWSDPIRDLPTAALRAAVAAERTGEAWLVANDWTSCHITAVGDVTPTTGWAALAARTITQRKAHTP